MFYQTNEETRLRSKIQFLEDKLLRLPKNNYYEIERLRGDLMNLRIKLRNMEYKRINSGRVY